MIYAVDTNLIPLMLREMCDTDEDPALASARSAYQKHLDALKMRQQVTPQSIETMREKFRKRKPL